MLTSGKNIRALRDKNINILILVLSAKKFLNETKNHNPPFKLNGRSLITRGRNTPSLIAIYIITWSLKRLFKRHGYDNNSLITE